MERIDRLWCVQNGRSCKLSICEISAESLASSGKILSEMTWSCKPLNSIQRIQREAVRALALLVQFQCFCLLLCCTIHYGTKIKIDRNSRISGSPKRRRLRLFDHVAPLPLSVPASAALSVWCPTRAVVPPDLTWRSYRDRPPSHVTRIHQISTDTGLSSTKYYLAMQQFAWLAVTTASDRLSEKWIPKPYLLRCPFLAWCKYFFFRQMKWCFQR